ncbi:hypothetical protein [Polaribacter vadi]|jgi:hypothetical protein|uniref:hypothetical protein n=1 Tax=Polaribacter vadi TaxID=1774273 RepID=UPI0030EC8B61|tara:strand:+ start:80190 stop:80849 length:660 start_codon:yes stop_codon:yes gene_type:complete
MERKHEITEKQLDFLENFIDKKYSSTNEESRIELIDHLISDFEATTENGNLSQYLSNEIEFIRRFMRTRVKLLKANYDRDVWQEYFTFFTSIKRIPVTLFCFFCIYFLSQNLNDKFSYLGFFFSVMVVYLYTLIAQPSNLPKKIKKLTEIQLLGKGITMGIPYIMCMIVLFSEIRTVLLESRIFFTFYWFFAFSLSVAVIIIMNQKKNIIIRKYKHLLN